ncbi:hypothetical protein LS73_006225 [Helicobacter muridarum]|uniref:Major facilitator superfamily protein n=1 Tax=Helicobacter muridarum TaxID=216 RepID=A0A377PXX3_9HELI|nr:hypothetical protein [Helicobacter muridarum]TLE00025.1 hypothetical protein LS73_006225 [Helicobacter muridarum]STQ87101.1 major facilitator superfamily protein [Helicobacter muridarum]
MLYFFGFQAVLNMLPLQTKNTFQNINQYEIGRLYMGYSIGIIASLMAGKITTLCGNKQKNYTIWN